jgi:hypothetical protein
MHYFISFFYIDIRVFRFNLFCWYNLNLRICWFNPFNRIKLSVISHNNSCYRNYNDSKQYRNENICMDSIINIKIVMLSWLVIQFMSNFQISYILLGAYRGIMDDNFGKMCLGKCILKSFSDRSMKPWVSINASRLLPFFLKDDDETKSIFHSLHICLC